MAAFGTRGTGRAGIRCALGGVRGVGSDIAGVVTARDIRGRVLLRHVPFPTARKDASETSCSASEKRCHARLLGDARAATCNHMMTRGVVAAALTAEKVAEQATACGRGTGVAVVSRTARVHNRLLAGVHPAGDSGYAAPHAAADQDQGDEEERAKDTSNDATDLRWCEASSCSHKVGGSATADDAAVVEATRT